MYVYRSYVVASFSEERKLVQLKMKVSRNIYSQPAREYLMNVIFYNTVKLD